MLRDLAAWPERMTDPNWIEKIDSDLMPAAEGADDGGVGKSGAARARVAGDGLARGAQREAAGGAQGSRVRIAGHEAKEPAKDAAKRMHRRPIGCWQPKY